jgi:hypothetical protein
MEEPWQLRPSEETEHKFKRIPTTTKSIAGMKRRMLDNDLAGLRC